jgi:hypothetical protein
MSRTRVYRVCLPVLTSVLIWPATFLMSESSCSVAKAAQQPGKPVRSPKPQNPPAAPKSKPQPAVTDVNLLSMELKALRVLRGFEATHHQLQVIAQIAKKTAGSPGNREAAKASGPYIQALVQMRHAYIANDEDQIEKIRTQLDELEDKSPPDLDDEVEVTDGAEIEAVRLLNIFSPQQIVAYAQSLEDDFPDPVQLVIEGLEQGRGLKKEEWETARNRLAGEVGWLVCGTQGEKGSKLEEQVSAYLDQKRAEEGKAGNRASEIRKLLGSPGPVVVLKNVMEHALAELLANPQVEKATRDCLRQTPLGGPRPTPANTGGPVPVKRPLPGPKNEAARPRQSKVATSTPKGVDLDDVLKSPEDYNGQELTFENVTVTGTAPAKLPANLWLEVKSGSGTVVHAGIRGQKLTFLLPRDNAPEAIKAMNEGESFSVTLTCSLRSDPQNKHCTARVHSVQVHGKK